MLESKSKDKDVPNTSGEKKEVQIPDAKKMSFKELLDVGYIKPGMEVKFKVDKEEKSIKADKAFLDLPIQDEEYYKKYCYSLVFEKEK